MTSPISSLKKGRKTPLIMSNGAWKRSMPFRDPDYSTNERLLLHEIHGHISEVNPSETSKESPEVAPHGSRLDSLRSSSNELISPFDKKQNSIPSDLDLLSSTMQKLAKLEKINLHYSREIIEKDKRIKVLEEKNRLMEKNLKLGQNERPPLIAELEAKCLELKEQVYEMEVYDIPPKTPQPTNIEKDSWYAKKDFAPNYDLIIENIKDLNSLAGDGEAKVVNTSSGAKLKMNDPIPLTLYKNGIVMFSGPFRSFDDQTTQRCMTDIMDGYFPSELQPRYPDGVPIKITDKRFVTFEGPRQLAKFPGVGNLLGGEEQPSSLVDTRLKAPSPSTSSVFSPAFTNSEDRSSTLKVTRKLPNAQLSVEQFVNRLPKTVIRNGNIINIRESIAEQLTDGYSSASSTELVKTRAVQEMQQRMSMPEANRPPSARNITTLRVKTEEGEKTLLIKMKFRETIGDLRKYIDKQRPLQNGGYEIFSTFPSKVYSDDCLTLEEYGLTPNANLFLRISKMH